MDKTKGFDCRGIVFYPEKSGTKLIVLDTKTRNLTDTTHPNISLDPSLRSETKNFLESLYNALEPDTKILVTPQIKLYISNTDCMSHLIIEISTSDMAELRSAINSYLRLIKTTHLCITNLLFV